MLCDQKQMTTTGMPNDHCRDTLLPVAIDLYQLTEQTMKFLFMITSAILHLCDAHSRFKRNVWKMTTRRQIHSSQRSLKLLITPDRRPKIKTVSLSANCAGSLASENASLQQYGTSQSRRDGRYYCRIGPGTNRPPKAISSGHYHSTDLC